MQGRGSFTDHPVRPQRKVKLSGRKFKLISRILRNLANTILGTALAASPQKSIGEETKYDSYTIVLTSASLGYCIMREGYLTEKESFKWQATFIREAGITVDQWARIMSNESFHTNLDEHLAREGGCKKYLEKGNIRELLRKGY